MKLGAFSVSLVVKDLKASQSFYENLGFSIFAGSMEQNYLIMKNEASLIGLFHGMFEHDILTFNPGWDVNANKLESFDDVNNLLHMLLHDKRVSHKQLLYVYVSHKQLLYRNVSH